MTQNEMKSFLSWASKQNKSQLERVIAGKKKRVAIIKARLEIAVPTAGMIADLQGMCPKFAAYSKGIKEFYLNLREMNRANHLVIKDLEQQIEVLESIIRNIDA